MKKVFHKLLLLFMVLALAIGLAACQIKDTDKNEVSDLNFESAYTTIVELGFTGTLDDFIAAFNDNSAYATAKAKGYSGSETEWLVTLASSSTTNDTPYIGANDNWFVGNIDTGVCARGKNGESAYEIFIRLNPWYEGDEAQWMNDLVNGKLVRYTVEFNSMGGSEIAAIENLQKGNKLNPPSTPIKTDYSFAGWFKESAGINEWLFASDKVTEDMTLYAKWTPVYFTYSKVEGGCEITGLTNLGKELTESTILEIPASIDGKAVMGIRYFAFSNGVGMFSGVIIPNSVKYIEEYAFMGCLNLENVFFESNSQLESIGKNAFASCRKLKSIDIPDSVKSIGQTAFMACGELESVTLGSGLTEIGSAAFGHAKITEITIPKNIQTLTTAFGACRSLEKVIFESGSQLTTLIGTFTQCQSLKEIELPDSLIEIGANTFSNCAALENISIPVGVTNIGNRAFEFCSSLKNIVIPNSVMNIGSLAFYDCTALTNITLPDSLTSIRSQTFQNCSSLTEIDVPNGVTSIGNNAFDNCSILMSIILPDTLISIGNYAFTKCSTLENIIIPSSVTSIGIYAFQSCSSLISVIIPESITLIGNYTFSNCSALRSIVIPSSVISIGICAFNGCNVLNTVYFGADRDTLLAITIDTGNTPLIVANIYFYSETSITDGKNWHFSGGIPEIWA